MARTRTKQTDAASEEDESSPPSRGDYQDLDFDSLDELREDLERTLAEGQEYSAALRAIRPYTNKWKDENDEVQSVSGLEFSLRVTEAEDPKDINFTFSQRAVWGSFAYKRMILYLCSAAGVTSGIRVNFDEAMAGESQFLNELVELQPTVRFIAGLEKWKDKESGENRTRTRIAKFLD